MLEVRQLPSRCWQASFLLEPLRNNLAVPLSQLLAVAGDLALAWLIDVSLQSLLPSSCGALPAYLLQFLSSYISH